MVCVCFVLCVSDVIGGSSPTEPPTLSRTSPKLLHMWQPTLSHTLSHTHTHTSQSLDPIVWTLKVCHAAPPQVQP